MVEVGAEDEAAWKEQFQKLAESTTGNSEEIELQDLGRALRMCSQYPTEEQIVSLKQTVLQHGELDADGESQKLPWTEFLSLCHECSVSSHKTMEELKEAFRIFDKDSAGQVSVNEFRYFMTHVGDKLEPEEFAELMAEAMATGCLSQPNQDNLLIDDFVKKIYPATGEEGS
eukprot:Hpha_TRINITY_DN13705_c0_g1::TRINITY_DN13705_c0_g1_i1::g.142795::m.142795/K02183/CALM; calmodulin